MQQKTVFTIFSFLFAFTSALLLIHKIDAFSHIRFLTSPKILYVLLIFFTAALFTFLWKKNNELIKKTQTALLIILPTIFLFFIGTNFFESSLHWIFSAIVGLYVILLGSTYIYGYHKKYQPSKNITKKEKRCTKKIAFALVLIATAIHLFFGLKNIGKAAYVDERLWIYDRIEQYWDNIIEKDWKNTRPSDKPGVTTALITGPGLLFFDPTDFNEGSTHKEQIESLFMSLRIPQFLVIALFSFFTFFFIKKLLNTQIATLTTIFIMLSPIILGISRIINPDAFLWIILFLCFISFLIYLRENTLHWIYVAGMLLGLALLTKYIANIFLVFFIILIFMDLILQREVTRPINEIIKERIIHYVILLFTALSTLYILYPGVWVKHDRLLIATIQSEAFASTWIYFALLIIFILIDTFLCKSFVTTKLIILLQKYKRPLIITVTITFIASAIVTIFNVYTEMSLFDFSRIIESPKSIYKEVGNGAIYFTSFFPLLFGVTPFVLFLSFFALYKVLRYKKWSYEKTVIIYCILFILLYYIASTINNVVPIIRYQIILYPFMILIAGIGSYMLINTFTKKQNVLFIASACIICIGSWQLAHMSNFYFSYNSPLLPHQYIINTKDMGDGNYEIAQYLNTLPHPEDLLIWTDKRGVCQFFVGDCNNMIKDVTLTQIAPDIDYYIISQNRKNHIEQLTEQLLRRETYDIHLDRLYEDGVPTVYEIYPNKRNAQYIKVIDGPAINIID